MTAGNQRFRACFRTCAPLRSLGGATRSRPCRIENVERAAQETLTGHMMTRLKTILNPRSYLRFIKRRLQERRVRIEPNLLGAVIYPPGHYYSPLLDIRELGPGDVGLPFDDADYWEHVDLRPNEQRSYYDDLLNRFPFLPFPNRKSEGCRYYTGQDMFVMSDAFTLSGVIRKEKPRKIVEVGSGFSSAVMLDTLEQTHASAALTFIEPYPDRLYSLLSTRDRSTAEIHINRVQEIPLSVFDELEAQDILFIDSSHVAKVGSDVTFLFLRVLPRLKPGVIVHVHDIFYPFTYPAEWIREGRAWNESLFLRAFLAGNPKFQTMAFNPYAGYSFPEVFRGRLPAFLSNSGGSIWLKKTS